MPYKKSYKKRSGYNKFQKKAYNRKKKNYKNRQQLLSIKTVKSIAKQVCASVPEVKFFENRSQYQANKSIQQPTDSNSHYISHILCTPTDITIGPQENQRIGSKIYVRSVRLKLRLHFPLQMDNDGTSATFRCGQRSDVTIKLLSLNSNGQVLPRPPNLNNDIVGEFWDFQRNLNMTTKDYNHGIKVHYEKRFVLKNEIAPNRGGNSTSCPLKTMVIDKSITINKHIQFTGNNDEDEWKRNLCLWVYAFGLNQHIPLGTTNWGGTPDYTPRVDYAYTVYYTDS